MLKTHRTPRGAGPTALAEYCDQLRYRRLHHARFTAERSARLSAEGAARQKSQFIAMMSHELRTPLNSIIGFSDILIDPSRRADPAEIADYARHINSSGRHLVNLVNSILEMSRIQSGAFDVDLGPHDVKAILQDGVGKLEAAARDKDVALATRFDDDAVAVVDAFRLMQSIENIVSNALKFTGPGGAVTLGCRRDGAEIAITIADSGIGMDREELARALTPFGQVSTGLDRGSEGTGLGLCIAKALTELQHGRFAIASAPGVGTEITLTFPAAPTANSDRLGADPFNSAAANQPTNKAS